MSWYFLTKLIRGLSLARQPWTELNHILQAHVVDGVLATFGCVEWESEQLCRGVMRARCYPFDMPKRRFHGFNTKVSVHTQFIQAHTKQIHVYTQFIHINTCIYVVHTSTYSGHIGMYLTISLNPLLVCAGNSSCCPSLSLLHWGGSPRCPLGRLLVPPALLYLLPASKKCQAPEESKFQNQPWWPPSPPGLLQHLWEAETAHQRTYGECRLTKLYEPSPTPCLYVAPAVNMVGRVPLIPVFLAGNSTPTFRKSTASTRTLASQWGSCEPAAQDGRRGSNVYEVNTWLWHWTWQAAPGRSVSGSDWEEGGCSAGAEPQAAQAGAARLIGPDWK